MSLLPHSLGQSKHSAGPGRLHFLKGRMAKGLRPSFIPAPSCSCRAPLPPLSPSLPHGNLAALQRRRRGLQGWLCPRLNRNFTTDLLVGLSKLRISAPRFVQTLIGRRGHTSYSPGVVITQCVNTKCWHGAWLEEVLLRCYRWLVLGGSSSWSVQSTEELGWASGWGSRQPAFQEAIDTIPKDCTQMPQLSR